MNDYMEEERMKNMKADLENLMKSYIMQYRAFL